MRKIILIIFVSFISLSSSSLKAEEYYDISKYFPMDVGNKWEYGDYLKRCTQAGEMIEETHTVISIKSKEMLDNKEVYLFEPDRDDRPTFYYSLGKEGIYCHKVVDRINNMYTIYSPLILVLPNNLQLNKEYKAVVLAEIYDPNGKLIVEGLIIGEVKFEGIEDITVPAGKFENCLKFSSSSSTHTIKTAVLNVTQTFWLAKDIGKVKEESSFKKFNEESYEQYNKMELKNAMIKGQKVGN